MTISQGATKYQSISKKINHGHGQHHHDHQEHNHYRTRASIMTLSSSSSSHPSSSLIQQPCVTSEPPVATITTITNLLFDPEALQLKRGCIFTRSKTFTLLQHEILLKLYILFNSELDILRIVRRG